MLSNYSAPLCLEQNLQDQRYTKSIKNKILNGLNLIYWFQVWTDLMFTIKRSPSAKSPRKTESFSLCVLQMSIWLYATWPKVLFSIQVYDLSLCILCKLCVRQLVDCVIAITQKSQSLPKIHKDENIATW